MDPWYILKKKKKKKRETLKKRQKIVITLKKEAYVELFASYCYKLQFFVA